MIISAALLVSPVLAYFDCGPDGDGYSYVETILDSNTRQITTNLCPNHGAAARPHAEKCCAPTARLFFPQQPTR